MLKHILKYIPNTRKLHLAVIGFPSSGKSYMLSDMITALSEMGYAAELPPLSYPHSSLGAFFYDAYNNESGGMKQTPPSACRTENHYGATMKRKGSNQRISIDFLNIPGETFREPEIQLQRYYTLRKAISNVSKGLFQLTTWRNPSGHEVKVLEPALDKRVKYKLPNYERLSKSKPSPFDNFDTKQYMLWHSIYAMLNGSKHKLVKRKNVGGDYVLNHFFEINTDSVFATIANVWDGFASGLQKEDYVSNNAFNDFYYMHYCSVSTDIVICDKLFVPGNTADANAVNFTLMTDVLHDLLTKGKHNAHVYLTFRGADLLMKKHGARYRMKFKNASLSSKRIDSYKAFSEQLAALLMSGETKSDTLVDPTPEGFTITTSSDLASHIKSRIGGDKGHCFKQLLIAAYKDKKHHQVQGQALPPHVYFTATPIDSDFNFYDNDTVDNTRFILGREVNPNNNNLQKTWSAFHLEVTRGGKHQLCFGSYQLLQDIFNQNYIIS